jgi:hypothetical protein
MLERLAGNFRGQRGIGDIAITGDHPTIVIDDNCSVCLDFLTGFGNKANHSIGDVMDEQAELRISALHSVKKIIGLP